MELKVRISPSVSKHLKAMRRAGGNAAPAAEHALAIINQLLEGVSSLKQIRRITRHGEARIPKSVKFDLVGGYRLLAVQCKQDISFLFVGSHDECDHWVKNNAGYESHADNRMPVLSRTRSKKDEKPSCRAQRQGGGMETDDYDTALLRDLTDRDLRKIFCGLCGRRA